MFLSRNDQVARFLRLQAAYQDQTEVHVSFYTSAISMFTRYNKFLQRSDPLAHKIYPVTKFLMKNIASRFIKPDVIRLAHTPITSTLDDEPNYLPLPEIFIGLATKSTLNKVLNDGDISDNQWRLCTKSAIPFVRILSNVFLGTWIWQ